MSSGSIKTDLQDTKEPIRIEASRKALVQDNCQVFLEDRLHPHQRRRMNPHHPLGEELIIVGVYVDDLFLGSRSLKALEWLKDQLMKEFNIKDLGEVKTIIGWEITQDLATSTLKINLKKYIQNLLKSDGMTSCHPIVLLVKAGSTLFLDQAGDHQQANLIAYHRLIGKLMYLNYGIHLDIALVVGQLSCHNSDLRM